MKLNLFLFASLAGLLLVSCSDTPDQTLPAPGRDGYISLEIRVPGHTEAATRALTAKDECEVKTLDVLAFNVADDKFIFHETGEDVADDPSAINGNKKTFYVKVPQDGTFANIYFMVIANARQSVDDAISGGVITTSTTRNAVMQSLRFTSSGKWTVMPGPFPRFPMWGQSQHIDLTAPAVTVAPISLIRSVAKIDIGIDFPANSDVPSGLGNLFKLETVHLYNARNELLIAPDPGNYSGSTVTAPSVPAGAVNAPIEYVLPSYNAHGKHGFMNEIYLAEHAAGSQTSRANNLCLVIGARFGSAAAEGTVITYYRIDFIKTTRDSQGDIIAQEFLPILRNHRYKINITQVHGKGYNTPAEAFAAMGVNTNLTVDILSDDESLTEYVYDGQYALGVGKGSFVLDKNAHSNMELMVHTTHEQGWTATVATAAASWLSITTGTGQQTGAGKSALKLNVTATTSDRTGIITIQSGRLFKEITVIQHKIGFIEILGKEIYYIMNQSNHSFTVKSPYDWQVKIKSDYHNILKAFPSSGTANIAGSPFVFKLENDLAYQVIKDRSATLTFYSLKDEFVDYDVIIRGVSCFDLGGVYVYPMDQPVEKWYTYANVPNNHNSVHIPPAGSQVSPPRYGSCAALKSPDSNKPWRLPVHTELAAIYSAASTGGTVSRFGFGIKLYWTAITNNTPGSSTYGTAAFYINFSNGSSALLLKDSPYLKTARCVRTK